MDIPGIPDIKMVEKCAKWKKVFGITAPGHKATGARARTDRGSGRMPD